MATLKETNGITLYHQIKEKLRAMIENGELKPGDKLPAETELASQYGVSRATIRRAITDMAREGYFYRKQGKGTFVSEPKINTSFVKVFFPTDFGDRHCPISAKIVEKPHRAAKILQVPEDTDIIEIMRLRFFDGEPVVLEKSYLPADRFGKLLEKLIYGKLYDVITRDYGIVLAKATTYIEPIVVDEYEARYLRVKPGTPALLLERVNSDVQGKPVVVTKSIVRGDRCRLFASTEE